MGLRRIAASAVLREVRQGSRPACAPASGHVRSEVYRCAPETGARHLPLFGRGGEKKGGAPGCDQAASDFKTTMSGAVSAFIPTTSYPEPPCRIFPVSPPRRSAETETSPHPHP